MPELDFALLCDAVRVERGVAHILAAGIDSIYLSQVPGGQNVGIVCRFTFTRQECGRPHRLEVIFQDTDGARLSEISAVMTPPWIETQPAGWPTGVIMGLNLGLPLPHYGVYAFEILVNDSNKRSLNVRVEPSPDPG